MNSCFAEVTVLGHLCVPEYVSGWKGVGRGVMVFKIKLDLGLMISTISFLMICSLSPQMLPAGFCHVNTEKIKSVTVSSSTRRVMCSVSNCYSC